MTHPTPDDQAEKPKKGGMLHPFRVAVLRGLGVVLPPLLTIVIFFWIGGTIDRYVVVPLTNLARNVIVWGLKDIHRASELAPADRGRSEVLIAGRTYRRVDVPPQRSEVVIGGVTYRPEGSGAAGPVNAKPTVVIDGVTFRRGAAETVTRRRNPEYVPDHIYQFVLEEVGPEEMPRTGLEVYQRYVELQYLRTHYVILFFTPLFIIVLYLLGKFMAAGIGRMAWNLVERAIRRVPLVSNVYSPVKQVSDFLLNDRDIRASRVVAVEWPRKGVWALGLVTGESMEDLAAAANEPVLSVLICTSPMPMTGFTVTVRKSETVDLNITIDQAFQFVISCGVVVPTPQARPLVEAASQPALPDAAGDQADGAAAPGSPPATGPAEAAADGPASSRPAAASGS